MSPQTFGFQLSTLTALFAAACLSISSFAMNAQDGFQNGCCINPEIKRPDVVSHATVSARVLAEALNCATNNISLGGTARLARDLGTADAFSVSYFYGKYMPEQEVEMLTIAIYSENASSGYLLDVGMDDGRYYLANLPQLRSRKKQWQVGEINGGLWSYTRLTYLAQEIGTRPRQSVSVSDILAACPKGCSAMNDQPLSQSH